jgi:hypothetical protein
MLQCTVVCGPKYKSPVMVQVKAKANLKQATKTQRRRRGVALLFF